MLYHSSCLWIFKISTLTPSMDLSFFCYLVPKLREIQNPDISMRGTHIDPCASPDPKTRITLVSDCDVRRSTTGGSTRSKLLRFGVRIEGPELDSVMIEHWPAITDKNRYEIYIYICKQHSNSKYSKHPRIWKDSDSLYKVVFFTEIRRLFAGLLL